MQNLNFGYIYVVDLNVKDICFVHLEHSEGVLRHFELCSHLLGHIECEEHRFQRLTGRILVGCQLGRRTTPRARRLLQLSAGVGVVPRSKNATFGMNSNFGIEIASPASRLV